MRRAYGIAVFLFSLGSVWANPSLTVPIRDEGFGAATLRSKPSFFLLDPSRFGMQQSYSMSYTSTTLGSYSSGVYVNTLSYRFGLPLTLSVDLAVHSTFQNTLDPTWFPQEESAAPKLLLPRVELEYRPTDNVTLNLQLLRFPDAWQAYGPYGAWNSPYGSWNGHRWKHWSEEP